MKRKLNIAILVISKFRNMLVRLFLWSEAIVRKVGGLDKSDPVACALDSFAKIAGWASGNDDVIDYLTFVKIGNLKWRVFHQQYGGGMERLNAAVSWCADELKKRGMTDDA